MSQGVPLVDPFWYTVKSIALVGVSIALAWVLVRKKRS